VAPHSEGALLATVMDAEVWAKCVTCFVCYPLEVGKASVLQVRVIEGYAFEDPDSFLCLRVGSC